MPVCMTKILEQNRYTILGAPVQEMLVTIVKKLGSLQKLLMSYADCYKALQTKVLSTNAQLQIAVALLKQGKRRRLVCAGGGFVMENEFYSYDQELNRHLPYLLVLQDSA